MTTKRSSNEGPTSPKRARASTGSVVLGLLCSTLAARAVAAEAAASKPTSAPATVTTDRPATGKPTSAPATVATDRPATGKPTIATEAVATDRPATGKPTSATAAAATDENEAPPLVWGGAFGIAAAVGAAGAASGLLLGASAEEDSSTKWASIGLYIGAGVALVTGMSLVIVGASSDAPADTAPTLALAPAGAGLLLHGWF